MGSVFSKVPDASTALNSDIECDFCSLADCYIGVHYINILESTGKNYEPKFKKKDRKNDNDEILCHLPRGSRIQFKMGNGKFTDDSEEAKIHLIKRNYP